MSIPVCASLFSALERAGISKRWICVILCYLGAFFFFLLYIAWFQGRYIANGKCMMQGIWMTREPVDRHVCNATSYAAMHGPCFEVCPRLRYMIADDLRMVPPLDIGASCQNTFLTDLVVEEPRSLCGIHCGAIRLLGKFK